MRGGWDSLDFEILPAGMADSGEESLSSGDGSRVGRKGEGKLENRGSAAASFGSRRGSRGEWGVARGRFHRGGIGFRKEESGGWGRCI
jgi:hypothetical protein